MNIKKSDCNNKIYISDGNNKLVDNGKEYFLIFSLPAITTCPRSTAMCRGLCYAKKSEVIYPNVLPSRQSNLEQSKLKSFRGEINKWINWNTKSRPSKKGKKVYFRIHESGDFYNMNYLKKWIDICNDNPNITFTAYTKSIHLIEQLDMIPDNLLIRFSLWADTPQDDIATAERLGLPTYTALDKNDMKEHLSVNGGTYCHCDCTRCKKCYSPQHKHIAVDIH